MLTRQHRRSLRGGEGCRQQISDIIDFAASLDVEAVAQERKRVETIIRKRREANIGASDLEGSR